MERARTPEDFAPVQLPATTINDLLSGTPVNQLREGMRVVRARNSSGSQWQTVDMRPAKMSSWTWALSSEDPVAAYRFDNGYWRSAPQFETSFGSNSLLEPDGHVHLLRPRLPDGIRLRVLGHWRSTSSTSYLWSPNGRAPLPYAELYLRPQIPSDQNFERIGDEGTPATQTRALVSTFASPTTWGVTGNLNGRTAEGNAPVQAFAEIGDTVYVGGNFTHAEQRTTGRMEPRTALAALRLRHRRPPGGIHPRTGQPGQGVAGAPGRSPAGRW
ncbi:hypothetical protein QP028_05075 [Corynebacterium suedekumii]|nr:hypothetical protein QP028_05075 [Corynebacterium suedekumii]